MTLKIKIFCLFEIKLAKNSFIIIKMYTFAALFESTRFIVVSW